LVVRATRTAPLGKAAKSSMLRTRKTGPWAWPGLPGRPERREVEEGKEVEEVEETDSLDVSGASCGVEPKREAAGLPPEGGGLVTRGDSPCATGAEGDGRSDGSAGLTTRDRPLHSMVQSGVRWRSWR